MPSQLPDKLYFKIGEVSELLGLPARRISDEALVALQSYEWPGNVRQLRNVIDWILIMAPGEAEDPVVPEMLPPDISAIVPETLRGDAGAELMTLPLRDAREVFERQYLEAQITRFSGNISRTANFVGMERSALHRKLRSLGINSGDRA